MAKKSHSWNKVSAKQELLAARGFKPFDFMVRRCEELAELVIEIDHNAEIALESRQKLVGQAQLILGGNVISKKAAAGKSDVAWVQASWAHPEGSERLDPISTFEVGVAVARNKRPYEECEKAARFLKFQGDLPEGLSMLPDEDDRHINVPMLGIILKPNLVEVRREGKEVDGKKLKGAVVGTSSIWHALIGFEERDKERFSKPTQAEKLEIEQENRLARKLQKEEKEKQERARKEQEEVDALGDCFDEVWDEWEAEQEELQAARRSEQWKEFIESSEELRVLWEKCKSTSNKAYERDRGVIEALQLVLRPTPSGKSDLKKALPEVRNHLLGLAPEQAMVRWSKLLAWVKDVPSRKGLSLGESLTKANADLPWLLPQWFVSEGGSVSPLYPLKGLRSYQREEWVDRVTLDPVISSESKEQLFSLAGEE
jgi:hypothetical protein